MKTTTPYWLLAVLLLLSTGIIFKGCKKDHSPVTPKTSGMTLKIAPQAFESQAKITALAVRAEGLTQSGEPNERDLIEKTFTPKTLPFDVLLRLYAPPYQWRLTVTITLARDAPLVASAELDLRQQQSVEFVFDIFEPLLLPTGADPLHVPQSADAGGEIAASCGPIAINAPDNDRFAVIATLSEEDGESISGPIDAEQAVAGNFADPYDLNPLPAYREFTCVIADGRSPEQTFTKTVQRIMPTPTPTPTPTCEGYLFDSKCWYRAPGGTSCTMTCESHGGVDASASTFWNNHTNTDCDTVLDALSIPSGYATYSSEGASDSCHYDDGYYSQERYREFGLSHNPDNSSIFRDEACACVN
jgi:hypothetical protein